MIETDSVYLTTSVYVPDYFQVEPEVLRAAERVTIRTDSSVVLAIRASTIDVEPNESLALLEPAWETTFEALTRVAVTSEWVRRRHGILNVRTALWPDRGPLQALMSPSMVARLSEWTADIYISVSRTVDADNDLQSEVCVYLTDQAASIGSPARALSGHEGRIFEPDALLRQQSFADQVDRALAGVPPSGARTAPWTKALRHLVVEFGSGSSDSGIVLTAPMLSRVASARSGVLLKAI